MNANNYTQKTIETLQTAKRMAEENHNGYITPEHILYGLVDQDGGLIPSLLGKMGVNCDTLLGELDTEISVGDKLVQVEYDYAEFHLSMGCYLCSIRSGRLTLKEHEASRWLAADELWQVKWLPSDIRVIEELEKRMKADS